MLSCDGPRICILMLNSPNIPKYGHQAAIVNYMYAAKQGYNFVVERCPQQLDMDKEWMWDGKNEYKMVWSKPALMKRFLQYYDYVVYMDSDAVFVDHEKKIQDVLQRYFENDPKVCMVMAKDCPSSEGGCSNVFSENDGNAGVIIAKNKKETFDVLQGWFDATSDKCARWKTEFPYEQACINSLKDSTFKGQIKIVDTIELGGWDGNWIRHLMSKTKEERETYIGGLLEKLMKAPSATTVPSAPSVEGFGTFRAGNTNPMLMAVAVLVIIFIMFELFLLFLQFQQRRK